MKFDYNSVRRCISAPILAVCVLTVSGCATISSQLPDLSPAELTALQQAQETKALLSYRESFDRLIRVAHPVLSKNSELCKKRHVDFGAVTHTLKSYDEALRPAAARDLGATKTPRIFSVRPESPAQKAGISPGDAIIIDGVPVSTTSKPFRAAMKAGKRFIIEKPDNTRVTVEYADVNPDKVCDYRVRLKMSAAVNAYADGRNITFTTAMIDFTQTDSELAAIVGHELAHNTQGHIRKIMTNVVLTAFAKRYTRPFESEADYVGLYYAARAGYDLEGIENFWERLSQTNPKYIAKDYTHPAYPKRALMIAATREEILQKQAEGAALIPNRQNTP